MTATAVATAAVAWAAALGLTAAAGPAFPRPERAAPSRPVAQAVPPGSGCTGGAGLGARCWPVRGPGPRGRPVILRGFDPPAQPWAAGHRGVDLAATPGAEVRAAAPGEVAFTGEVAGTPILVIDLPGGLRTTYEPVRATLPVHAPVPAGRTVGNLTGSLPHCRETCLHWGLLRDTVYLDPLLLLPPSLRRAGPARLLPAGG